MANANQRVGEYVLDARVGGGAFGEVWRAHHHAWTDQLVAVKIPTDPQYLRNLQHEGYAIHGLQHPNIVRAIGFDPFATTPYLAMEYVPGTSLRPLIAGRKLSINDAVAVLRQVLAGLGYAHANGLVHRDVKPENVLVHERAATAGFGTEGLIKVTDFGLGKAAAMTAATSIAYSASMNDAAGRDIAGTLDYMAPEQRAGGPVDARADLYSCGVVLYELLTGERPAGHELPSDINPSVPKSLDEVFRRSYARLERRYGSAAEFATALAAAAPAPRAVPPPYVQPTRPTMPFPPPVPPVPGPSMKSTLAGCPRCHQSVESTDQFCMHCGVQLVAQVRRCRKCGAYPDATDRYCIFCGETLKPEMAAV